MFEPNKEDRWSAHADDDGCFVDYRGWGRTDALATLHYRIGNMSFPVTDKRLLHVVKEENEGEVQLFCQDTEPYNNLGQIRVSVTVKPARSWECSESVGFENGRVQRLPHKNYAR